MNKQFLIIFTSSILTLGMFFGLQYIFAWTNPTLNPPSANVSPPINEGTTAQAKDGSLGVSGNLTAPVFYDVNNTGYYVDPAGTSKFSTINLGGVSRSSWSTVACNWSGWLSSAPATECSPSSYWYEGRPYGGCPSYSYNCVQRSWSALNFYCSGGAISQVNSQNVTYYVCEEIEIPSI